jgi:hypothetical protein
MAKKSKELDVSMAEVVDYLRMSGSFTTALRDVIERKIAVDAARKKGLKITNSELQKAADAFRVANGLNKASDTEEWMSARGITLDAMEEYLESNLLISKLKDDLEKKAPKTKYMSSPVVKETIREMSYRDWINKALK